MRWALLLLLGVGCSERDLEEIVVFSAASLTDAVEVLADDFEHRFPQYRVVVAAGATSLMARQIEQGAPADVFFSANLAWMEHLGRQGRIAYPVHRPMGNTLVVAGPLENTTMVSLEALRGVERIAIADPDHVPAGIYAREGLECALLWDSLEERMIPMLDVRAALLSVSMGAADVAIVYASDVRVAPSLRVLFIWPDDCAPDILYTFARLKDAPNRAGAELLLAFATDTLRAHLWNRFGFAPGEGALRDLQSLGGRGP